MSAKRLHVHGVPALALLWLIEHNDESPNPDSTPETLDDRELRRAVASPDARVLVDGAPHRPIISREYSHGYRPMWNGLVHWTVH